MKKENIKKKVERDFCVRWFDGMAKEVNSVSKAQYHHHMVFLQANLLARALTGFDRNFFTLHSSGRLLNFYFTRSSKCFLIIR